MLELAIKAEEQRYAMLLLLICVGEETGAKLELVIRVVEHLVQYTVTAGMHSYMIREHAILPLFTAGSCEPSICINVFP